MEGAKYLLETSFLSIKEITYRVGINDESHFVRDFKRTYGNAPSHHRMRMNEQATEALHVQSAAEIRATKNSVAILIAGLQLIAECANALSMSLQVHA